MKQKKGKSRAAPIGGAVVVIILIASTSMIATFKGSSQHHLPPPSTDPLPYAHEIKHQVEVTSQQLSQLMEAQQRLQSSSFTSSELLASEISQVNAQIQQVSARLDDLKRRAAEISIAEQSANIDALIRGNAAVSAPTSAKKSAPFRAILRLQRGRLSTFTQELASEVPGNKVQGVKADVKMTPLMTATISGEGYEFSPKDPITQVVSTTDATTWEWSVKPTDSGSLPLHFVLAGTLNVEGAEVPRQFFAYTQTVVVSVGLLGFIQEYWQWIATTILIPSAVAGWAWFRKSKGDGGGTRTTKDRLRDQRNSTR